MVRGASWMTSWLAALPSWRRSTLDAQHVSRVKRVIAGIKARMEGEDESLEEAIAFLDGIFKE